MTLTLQPTRVATGFDEDDMLVFDERQRLVAVLTHFSDHDQVAPGQWYPEVGFGSLDGITTHLCRSGRSPGVDQPAPHSGPISGLCSNTLSPVP